MTDTRHVVGIDLGKQHFHATLCLKGQPVANRKFRNDDRASERLLAWVGRFESDPCSALFCVEQVGVYSERLCFNLLAQGALVQLANATRVHRSIKNPHLKTDQLDSLRVAQFATKYPEDLIPYRAPDPFVARYAGLVKARQHLVKLIVDLKNVIEAASHRVITPTESIQVYRQTIADLQDQVKRVNTELIAMERTNPQVAQGVKLLTSIRGVGRVLASNMVVYTDGFKRIPKYRQAASHLGIAPYPYESGTSVHRKPRSKQHGPATMRKLLYMSVLASMRHNSEHKAYFHRKVKQGKPAALVMNNLRNKQLKIMLAILGSWKPYDENHRSVHPKLMSGT